MRPNARFQLPDGRLVELGHGDLIGRLESAALHLSDPRISEAHAMVSLRGTSLRLLALRGRMTLNGVRQADLELQVGQRVSFARDLDLEVVAVTLPERVPALRVGGTQERVLTGVCSTFLAPGSPDGIELRPGFHPDAVAYLWTHRDGFVLRRTGRPDQTLSPGDAVEVDGHVLEVVEMALTGEGQYVTTARGALAGPIELVVRYESASIHRTDEPTLVLTGLSARILSELVSFGVPVHWATIAKEIWPEELALEDLRVRWDVNLGRLRRKLQDARVRPDLVRPDGHGNVELLLERDDRVRDES